MTRWLALWFSLRIPVSRRDYLISGITLLLAKYAAEAGLYAVVHGGWYSPWAFVDPLVTERLGDFGEVGAGVVFLWTLPFVWVGLSMSFRRARDAGLPAAVGALFLVPVVNWLAMGVLAALPSKRAVAAPVAAARADAVAADPPVAAARADAGAGADAAGRGFPLPPPSLGAGGEEMELQAAALPPTTAVMLASVAAGVGIGAGMVALSVYLLRDYGMALFVLTPVLMGMVSGGMCARGGISLSSAVWLGQGALVVGLMGMVLVAAEGAACVVMAFPLLVPLVLVGSSMGWHFCGGAGRWARSVALVALAALPLVAWHDAEAPRGEEMRSVATVVEIDAPPAVVWRRVVGFPDLPPPDGVFRLGIACPLRATITGSGVGAVRRCEFTTGAFVEPITAWEPGRRLAFDVVAQPPAMKELSPWPEVQAPHLDGYLESRRGEFLLEALPGGRTRLTGTTWYTVDIHPEWYWAWWADGFIHGIHGRVLRHIQGLAEADALGGRPDGGMGNGVR